MADIKIITLGGSIVAPPEGIDTEYLTRLKEFIGAYLEEDTERKLAIVIGGGGAARTYQNALKAVVDSPEAVSLDMIGIMATRLNAQLLKEVLGEWCSDPVAIDPHQVKEITGQVLLAAGWKPGFSTDNVAVTLAQQLNAKTVLNLTNIDKVYTDDPRKNPNAEPIDTISWKDFKALVGDTWEPGKNVPFDPVATATAAKLGLKVIAAHGKKIENLKKVFEEKDFTGTVIGPE